MGNRSQKEYIRNQIEYLESNFEQNQEKEFYHGIRNE